MEFVQAFDLIDATQNLDPFVAVSGAVKACAVTLSKIANDLRLMSSAAAAPSLATASASPVMSGSMDSQTDTFVPAIG